MRFLVYGLIAVVTRFVFVFEWIANLVKFVLSGMRLCVVYAICLRVDACNCRMVNVIALLICVGAMLLIRFALFLFVTVYFYVLADFCERCVHYKLYMDITNWWCTCDWILCLLRVRLALGLLFTVNADDMCLAVGWCIWISLMNLCVGLVRYSGLLIVRLGPAICSVEFPVSGDCGLGFSFVVKAVTRPGCRDDHVHLLWVVFPVYFSDCFNVVRVDLMIVFVGCFVWCEYIACFYGWTFIGNCYYICREVLTFAFCSGLWCDPWGGTVGGFLLCGLLWSGFVASFVHSCDNPLRLTEFAEILVFYVFQVLYSVLFIKI
eukprot:gene3555-2506_t